MPAAIQAHNPDIPAFFKTSEFLNSLPYLMTIVVLVMVSTSFARRRIGAPAALGVAYVREER